MVNETLEVDGGSSGRQAEFTRIEPIVRIQKSKQNLEQIFLSHKKLAEIKGNLDKMVDAMAQHPSIFSRASKYWGDLPWWQKVLGGIAVVAPTLIIAIIGQIISLFVLSAFILAVFVGCSVILDNHHSHSVSGTENLKEGISGLADTLGIVIQTLGQMTVDLAASVEEFQQEIEKLSHSVKALSEQVSALTIQAKKLEETVKALTATKDLLARTANELSISIQEQTRLVDETEQALNKVRLDYEENQKLLSEKIIELDEVKKSMGLEIDAVRAISTTLDASVKELSEVAVADDKARAAFQQKLETFLGDEKSSFHQVVDRICEAEVKLVAVQKQLQAYTDRFGELLDRQDEQVTRLEAGSKLLGASSPATTAAKASSSGFYAVPKKKQTGPDAPHAEQTAALAL